MIPSWITNTLILILGCIFAIFIGSTLPQYDMLGAYLLGVAVVCTFCIVSNNFPLLLAFAVWFPFAPPIPFFRTFPTIGLVMAWISVVLFFRVCMTKTLNYVPSCNLFMLACFAWVPIRFALNPVQKLGGTVAGGHGVSGANAYFLYALAGILVVGIGCVLNTRVRLIQYMMWTLRCCFLIGVALLICAFIPATWRWLGSMGMFTAGTMSDGILRLVALPGYGLILVQAALCPGLFRLNKAQSLVLFALGFAMIIIGGNRSTMAAALLVVPISFFLRGKVYTTVLSLASFAVAIVVLHAAVDQMGPENIPTFARSLGMFDAKIANATGGKGSADWRYKVWQSGWNKIMESPLTGKGFGNLDKHVDIGANGASQSTDFETVLAGGEAHNGFISAAYGFGLPFMVGLSLALLLRMFSHSRSALIVGSRDVELRDFHVFLAGSFATFGVLIYSAYDLSVAYFWIYTGIGMVMDRVSRKSAAAGQTSATQAEAKSREVRHLFPGSLIQKY